MKKPHFYLFVIMYLQIWTEFCELKFSKLTQPKLKIYIYIYMVRNSKPNPTLTYYMLNSIHAIWVIGFYLGHGLCFFFFWPNMNNK